MSSDKPLNELSNEELEKALENRPEPVNYNKKGDNDDINVLLFFSTYTINSGSHVINKHLLFKLYRHWCSTKLNDSQLTLLFNKHLIPHYKKNVILGYNINQDLLTISNELLKILSEGEQKEQSSAKLEEIQDFIDAFKLEDGKALYHREWMYALYTKWANTVHKKTNYIKKEHFWNICAMYFPVKENYYYINNIPSNYFTPMEQQKLLERIGE